jgi:protein TonB
MELLFLRILTVTQRWVFYQQFFQTKIVVMKPELILQADLLDIVFTNRNKAYGAYSLRKTYNARLTKATVITFSIACLLSISWFVQGKYFGKNRSVVAGQPVVDVHLKDLDNVKKVKRIEKQKTAQEKKMAQVAQVAHVTVRIVPNDEVDKEVPKNDDLEGKIISNINAFGDRISEDNFLPPVSDASEHGAVIEPKQPEVIQESKPLERAEVMPEFPGGMEAFRRFMLRNLREPDDLQEGEKIVVMVTFVVETDGSIVNAEITKSGGRYDEEVLRVVKKMPRWKPGIQNGSFVPVYFTLPVTFTGREG